MTTSEARRPRGQPTNPYRVNAAHFAPKATVEWLRPAPDLGARATPSGDGPDHDQTTAEAYSLIFQIGLPVLRRVVESILVHDHGGNPVVVTHALDRIVEDAHGRRSRWPIHRTEMFVPGQYEPSHVFTACREPTRTELRVLLAMCQRRDASLSKEILRVAGERYVRAWFAKYVAHTELSSEADCGKVKIGGKGKTTDVLVRLKSTPEYPSGELCAVSVKNQREWLSGHVDRVFDDALARAHHFNATAWLFVPFALDTGMARCRASRIRLTTLGKQIAPLTLPRRNMRVEIEKLRPVLGVEDYGFVYARADRSDFTGLTTYEPDQSPSR